MGIGYSLGCLVSILLWSFERERLFCTLDRFINKFIGNKAIRYTITAALIGIILFIFIRIKGEYMNFIAAFLVIDLSHSERENIDAMEIKFHKTIAIACRALVCGFTAPLLYLVLLGNYGALIYFLLYNLCSLQDYKFLHPILRVLTIIPGIIAQGVLYLIYLVQGRGRAEIDFKGDYFTYIWERPLLNVEITAACMEDVSFYYFFSREDKSYMKSYGSEKKLLDEDNIQHYIGTLYLASFMIFLFFIGIYIII